MLLAFLAAAALSARAMPVARLEQEAPSLVQAALYRGSAAAADDGLWSSVVQLWSRHDDCSGTLVAADVVLTAAHCVKSDAGKIKLPESVRFFDGRGKEVVRRRVVDARFPAGYGRKGSPQRLMDVALVLFEGQAPSGHLPLALADDDAETAPGSRLLVAGYGIVRSGKEIGLRKAPLWVREVVGVTLTLTRRDRAGICDGDSGGPALLESERGRRVAGVASASDGRCRGITGSDFVSVPRALGWIEPNLKAFEAAAGGALPRPGEDTYDVLAHRAPARRKAAAPRTLSLAEPRFD